MHDVLCHSYHREPNPQHTLNLNREKKLMVLCYQRQAGQVYLPVPEGHLYHGPGFKVVNIHSVQFSRSVVSNSLQPHESQHARPPCPSPSAERLLCAGRASPSPAQLLAFAPGKEQAAGVWEP